VKELALLAAILVVLATGWLLWTLLERSRTRSLPPARWTAVHHSLRRGGVEVRLECPGEEPVYFDTIQPTDPALNDKLHAAMAEAHARAAALNSERR
jgi:hypothetical protein